MSDDLDGTGDIPTRETLFSVLADRRRRRALQCLETAETPMTVTDLSDEFVRRMTDESPPAARDEREQVRISLYHCHLPKLDDADLVSFDADRKLVDIREDAADRVLTVVQASAEEHS